MPTTKVQQRRGNTKTKGHTRAKRIHVVHDEKQPRRLSSSPSSMMRTWHKFRLVLLCFLRVEQVEGSATGDQKKCTELKLLDTRKWQHHVVRASTTCFMLLVWLSAGWQEFRSGERPKIQSQIYCDAPCPLPALSTNRTTPRKPSLPWRRLPSLLCAIPATTRKPCGKSVDLLSPHVANGLNGSGRKAQSLSAIAQRNGKDHCQQEEPVALPSNATCSHEEEPVPLPSNATCSTMIWSTSRASEKGHTSETATLEPERQPWSKYVYRCTFTLPGALRSGSPHR